MFGYVYLTKNLINGKMYIGQHRYDNYPEKDDTYLGSGKCIIKAFSKYGKENFSCRILQWCKNPWELDAREKAWILMYNAVKDKNFYNLKSGGSCFVHPVLSGENNPVHKLTNKEVIEIIKLHNSGLKNSELSKKFNISQNTISSIINGYTWSKLTQIKCNPTKRKDYCGEIYHSSTITDYELCVIFDMLINKKSIKCIHEKTNISYNVISDIKNGHTWSHLTGLTPENSKEYWKSKNIRLDKRKTLSKKLDKQTVLDIVENFKLGFTQKELMDKFNCSYIVIHYILTGKNYTSITNIKESLI